MKSKTSEILKNVGGFIVVLFFAWVILSLAASIIQQASNVNNVPLVCDRDYYIEYILFTDMFCEVSK